MLQPENGRRTFFLARCALIVAGAGVFFFLTQPVSALSAWPIRAAFLFVVALFYRHLVKARREEARAAKERELAAARSRALRDIDLVIRPILDARAVLDILLENIDRFYPGQPATIRLLDDKTGVLEPIACRNLNEAEWKAATASARAGLNRMLAEHTQPLIVHGASTDPRSLAADYLRREGIVSYVRIPLAAKDKVLGVLTCFTREARDLRADEVEFLAALAARAATAIHNAALYAEAVAQAADLARANTAKDEFLGIVSHELKTPLNVIQGYTALLTDGVFGKVTPEQEGVLERILKQTKNELNIVNDLLHLSRLSGAEGVTAVPAAIHPGELLEELRLMYEAIKSKEPSLSWDYPADLPVIETDREKLKHILQNLINNALKFTDKGRVTVSARYFPERKEMKFAVTDTGIGIPREQIPTIFDMFRRAESARVRMSGGVGLGLYIVRKFTDLIGGKVEVESVPDRGSSFTVRLSCQKWN